MQMTSRLIALARAILFFLPEIALSAWILFDPKQIEQYMMSVATLVFGWCAACVASRQFSCSVLLVIFCLFAHLLRFGVLQRRGDPLLRTHRPSAKELAVAGVVVFAYAVFLVTALEATLPLTRVGNVDLGIFDVFGASVAAFALIVISIFVVRTFAKRGHK